MQYGDLCDINELRQFIAYIAAYTSKSLQAFNKITFLSILLLLNYNEYVPEGEKTLIFNNRKGSFTYNVENDEFRIPAAATTEERVQMQLEIKTEDQIWLSENIDLKLYKKADASGKNLLEDLIEEEVAASTQNITNKLYNFYDKYAKEVRENE